MIKKWRLSIIPYTTTASVVSIGMLKNWECHARNVDTGLGLHRVKQTRTETITENRDTQQNFAVGTK